MVTAQPKLKTYFSYYIHPTTSVLSNERKLEKHRFAHLLESFS